MEKRNELKLKGPNISYAPYHQPVSARRENICGGRKNQYQLNNIVARKEHRQDIQRCFNKLFHVKSKSITNVQYYKIRPVTVNCGPSFLETSLTSKGGFQLILQCLDSKINNMDGLRRFRRFEVVPRFF